MTASIKNKSSKNNSKSKDYKISEGDKVAAFKLESTSGELFDLKDYKGKKIILYFYPKDSTPGCTIEGDDFTKLSKKFDKLGVSIFGISRDSLKSHQNFKEKQKFCFDLLVDSDEVACKIFDVIQEKNMYGKKIMGIERSTFVIDKNSKILKQWRKVKVKGHAQEVLEFVESLS